MWNILPNDIKQKIYEYDNTYTELYSKCIKTFNQFKVLNNKYLFSRENSFENGIISRHIYYDNGIKYNYRTDILNSKDLFTWLKIYKIL